MRCENCGYGFMHERRAPEKVYHVCPNCGYKFPGEVKVGIKQEGSGEPKHVRTLLD